jgi:hypothetical protein
MKLLENDFLAPFVIGFAAASALVLATMNHAPPANAPSLLPMVTAAGAVIK